MMKINYVLLYGTPYLKYELFDTFKKMSDFIVKKSIVNYSIFKKLEDKEEVEMIYRDNDIRVLEDRIDKALEYIKDMEGFELDDCKLWKILKGRDNITISREQRLMNRIDKAIEILQDYDLVENKDKVISDTFKALRGEDND